MISCIKERIESGEVEVDGRALTIRCYLYPLLTTSPRPLLKPDRKLVFEALTLLMRLDRELREVRVDWNQDRFRRLMRSRPRVIAPFAQTLGNPQSATINCARNFAPAISRQSRWLFE